MLTDLLGYLVDGRGLDAEQLRDALTAIMTGQCPDLEIAAFLTAMRMKGETAADLATAAQVLRAHAVPFAGGGRPVLDTCGTGGDGLHTLNVSTAAALVAAACGVPVVKHGNRGVSSSSGSADVLVALGVPIELEAPAVERCFCELGFAFCFAPRFHPAMRHVASVRKSLRFRTLFNLLGPLCNPAHPKYQVLGVGKPDLLDKMAETLALLGVKNAYVIHAEDGLDEVSLCAPTHVRHVRRGEISSAVWLPRDFQLSHVAVDELRVDGAAASAERIRAVLAGLSGPARDVIVANAAIGLLAAEHATSLCEGVQQVQTALDNGSASRLVDRLTRMR